MSDTVLQSVAAAPGWRQYVLNLNCQVEDLGEASADDLFDVRSVAVFALVDDHRGFAPKWKAVVAERMGSGILNQLVTPDDPYGMSARDPAGLLAPGEHLDHRHFQHARTRITEYRGLFLTLAAADPRGGKLGAS